MKTELHARVVIYIKIIWNKFGRNAIIVQFKPNINKNDKQMYSYNRAKENFHSYNVAQSRYLRSDCGLRR